MTDESSFQAKKDIVRERLNRYTRKAFYVLPKLNNPKILDIGCGSGISTLEIAKLSHGEVLGIDIDQPALDKFSSKIIEAELIDQVQVRNCSLFHMDFKDGTFDIILSEGSIYAIGFERGLREWRRFLKPGGFMVIHDEQGNVKEKLEQISDCGYKLLDYFVLSKETWWSEYFAPLEKLIVESRTRYADPCRLPHRRNSRYNNSG